MSARKIQPVRLPASFTDPEKQSGALERKVREKLGSDWRLESIDMTKREAIFVSTTSVSTVEDQGDHKIIRLPETVKPSDGPAQAKTLEEIYEGFTMVKFDPYGKVAHVAKLNPSELRARLALANALSVKPWDVGVKQVKGGFNVDLPTVYSASRHDKKLEEAVTTIIGKPGWVFDVDAPKLTMQIRKGELPIFEPIYKYPFDAPTPRFTLKNKDWADIPIGVTLATRGDKPNTMCNLNFVNGVHTQVGGLSGAGKSVTMNAAIYGWLSRGFRLSIIDLPAKSVDFAWVRPWLTPNMGWGCENLDEAVTVLGLIMEEGDRRSALLKKYGVTNYRDLPIDVEDEVVPHSIVCDEVTGLLSAVEEPKMLPKDHPLRIEAQEENLKKTMLKRYIMRITAELRFVGIGLLLGTQVASSSTGLGPNVRINLQNKMLLGSRASKSQRNLIFPDETAVPVVPEYIRSDENISRGCGAFDFEGARPGVFKSYFASVNEFQENLRKLGLPTSENSRPSATDIARIVPSLDDYGSSYEATSRAEVEGYGYTDGSEPELRGAAKASHDLAMSAALLKAKKRDAETEI
ncbi:hypothetical protein [Actinomyces vulturis]|uniref:hypothetical protein n=1 Tax=Actinomyces vulturis TaxID=1857645 RepID=UPI000829DCF2|nr:hypothetical protein [Actinomyces vulturis]